VPRQHSCRPEDQISIVFVRVDSEFFSYSQTMIFIGTSKTLPEFQPELQSALHLGIS